MSIMIVSYFWISMLINLFISSQKIDQGHLVVEGLQHVLGFLLHKFPIFAIAEIASARVHSKTKPHKKSENLLYHKTEFHILVLTLPRRSGISSR